MHFVVSNPVYPPCRRRADIVGTLGGGGGRRRCRRSGSRPEPRPALRREEPRPRPLRRRGGGGGLHGGPGGDLVALLGVDLDRRGRRHPRPRLRPPEPAPVDDGPARGGRRGGGDARVRDGGAGQPGGYLYDVHKFLCFFQS